MHRIALALGLLVTPAAAETYTPDECKLIKELIGNCTARPKCDAFEGRGSSEGYRYVRGILKSYRYMVDAHPGWDGDKFDLTCAKLCKHQVAPAAVLHKFCSRTKQ
ncbi:hypothetical protein ACRQ5Q_39410 [Bradyrhizobium sp. PMVTL-01]|uniref:hypothetical protein n=1 Tax=Bradyrhizobium sp. PMVTL-01 TaxID=3434999 RepID=UPI003F6E646D